MSRVEHRALAATLRRAGTSVADTAAALRDRYGVNGRLAVRTAHGWSQSDVAEAWSRRWPDDPKTFKNVSYWENWPGPTGHAPSLAVLDRLAQLYECEVTDLLAGWGEHGPIRASGAGAERETLTWQAEHLDLPELTRSLSDWGAQLATDQRRTLLLKLSTAASIAATEFDRSVLQPGRLNAGIRTLIGAWESNYSYHSTSRGGTFEGTHRVELTIENERLVGRSHPQALGSELHLDMAADGGLLTGTWVERTSPTGHYRAATYHGVLQLVTDPTRQTLSGRWLGISKRYTVKSGTWTLERVTTTGHVMSATTSDPAAISPPATSS